MNARMRLFFCVVFALVSATVSAQYTKLVEFTGPNGYEPWGSLILEDGYLYGLTSEGGANNMGTVFKVRTDGTDYVILLDFDGAVNGSHPLGSLYSDGTFLYGMTNQGGTNNFGTIFKILKDGTGYVKLLDFAGTTNGRQPNGSLISDGTHLYGMTLIGGTNNLGAIFKILKDGTGYTKLLDFTGTANGSHPYGDLLLIGTTLYGMASAGGSASNNGSVFRIGTDGTGFVRMLSLSGFPNQGSEPLGSLVYDGTFLYGMTSGGGSANDGTIFRIRPDGGGVAWIHSFYLNTGDSPFGSLTFVGSTLYGMTYFGGEGTNDLGTLFKINTNGTGHVKLFDFNTVDKGWLPSGSVVSDGTFLYGMTQQGGVSLGGGVVFKYALPPVPTITGFTPSSGTAGTSVTITGTNFSTTTAGNEVSFNGVPSVSTASTATSITVTVPAGATTGPISVTVLGNTGTSTSDFTIIPGSLTVPTLDWAGSMVGSFDVGVNAMTTDPSGNVYTVGWFSQTADFDPGPGVLDLTSAGNSDLFIRKQNPQGDLEWAFRIGGATPDVATAVASDLDGNIYVVGHFGGTLDFDPGAGTTTLSAPSGGGFFCKYDPDGNLIWARQLSPITNPASIAVEGNANVYLAAGFTGTVDFDPGAATFNMTSAGSADIYILKLTSAGNFVWARRMGSTTVDFAYAIALDGAGNVHTTGHFGGTVDFDPETGTANLTSSGTSDIFISKLTSAGSYVWARRIGGPTGGSEIGHGIAVDPAGNVLSTGNFNGFVDFDPGAAVTTLVSRGSTDIYVLKLNSAGNFVWARGIGGYGTDIGYRIATDASGNVYYSGEYQFTVDFCPGAGNYSFTTGNFNQAFASGLDASGNFVWAWSTSSGSLGLAEIPIISRVPNGDVILAGRFELETVDFDPGTCLVGLTPGGGIGSFVVKLSPNAVPLCTPTIANMSPSSGFVGSTVTITGANFSTTPSDNEVTFNGVAAVVTASTLTSITTTVPSGATTGPVTVTVLGSTGTSATDFLVNPGSPVAPQLAWARSFVGSLDIFLDGMTTDPSGNVYTVGMFSETTDFDPGAGVFNLTSAGGHDIFVSKVNPQGEFEWAFSVGGPYINEAATGVASDAAGNIYVAGTFSGPLDFDPGPGITTLPGPSIATFLCKYDPDGNLLWARQLDVDLSGFVAIAADGNDHVYFAGGFVGTRDFDPGASVFNMTSAGGQDIYILKLSSTGDFVWARRMGGTGPDLANKIALDVAGNVHTIGIFSATVDFDPETGTANLTAAGANDVFISKLSPAGSYVWSRRVGGGSGSSENANGIAIDMAGNVLVTGSFTGTADFDPGAATNNLTSAGSQDIYVLKLNVSGNLVWVRVLGGTGNDRGYSISTDALGNVYYSGDYQQTVDFNPGPDTHSFTTGNNDQAFASRLDPYGNFVWAWSSSGPGIAEIPIISRDPNGDIVLAGYFQSGTVNFDPGTCVAGLTAETGVGAFIVKLSTNAASPCAPTITNLSPSSGSVGTTVTITGTNFSSTPADNVVSFNGVVAVVTASTSTSITTTVPSGATTGPVSVTVEAYTGTSSGVFTVTTPAIVFITQPSDAIACTIGNNNLTVNASGDTNLVYQWQVDNAGFVNLSNDAIYSGVNTAMLTIHNPATSMSGSIYRVLVHGDNTSDTPSSVAILTVNVSPASPGVSTPASGCAPFSTTLTASGATDGQYRWYLTGSNGTPITGAVNSTYTTPALSATTIYYVAVYDGSCESLRSPVIVTVEPTPAAPGTMGAAGCSPASVVLTATGSPDGNYRWYDVPSGGSPLAGEQNSAFSTPVLTSTTSYYVSVVDGACESSRSEVIANISVVPSPPSATAASGCVGTSVVVDAAGGADGQYRWYTVVTGGTPMAGEVNGQLNTPALTVSTSYFVAINNGNCESARTEVIAGVVAVPSAPVVSNPPTACPLASVTLTASGGVNGNYRWYDGSTPIPGEANSTVVVTPAASKTYHVALVNGACESAKSQIAVTVAACTPPTILSTTSSPYAEGPVTIDLRPLISDPENNLDESSLQVEGSLASGAPFTLNGFILTIDYAGVLYPGSEVLTLRICDLTFNCTTQVVTIELSAELVVYNALSPNGDNKNDVFIIGNIDNRPDTRENKVIILNRWGDVVFEVANYDNDTRAFRGRNRNGNELPAGTYYYRIEFLSGGEAMTGYLSLKR